MSWFVTYIGLAVVVFLFLLVRRISEKGLPPIPKRKPAPPPPAVVPSREEIARSITARYEEDVLIIDSLPLPDDVKADGRDDAQAQMIQRIQEIL